MSLVDEKINSDDEIEYHNHSEKNKKIWKKKKSMPKRLMYYTMKFK